MIAEYLVMLSIADALAGDPIGLEDSESPGQIAVEELPIDEDGFCIVCGCNLAYTSCECLYDAAYLESQDYPQVEPENPGTSSESTPQPGEVGEGDEGSSGKEENVDEKNPSMDTPESSEPSLDPPLSSEPSEQEPPPLEIDTITAEQGDEIIANLKTVNTNFGILSNSLQIVREVAGFGLIVVVGVVLFKFLGWLLPMW